MTRVLILILFILIAGCASILGNEITTTGEIRELGEDSNYPLVAAGFKRGRIFAYIKGEEKGGFSIAYNFTANKVRINSILYLILFSQNLEDLFEIEKQKILSLQQNSELLNSNKFVLSKNSAGYKALQASYKVPGKHNQDLFFQLTMWKQKKTVYKLLSASPYTQKEQNLTQNLLLIETLNWDSKVLFNGPYWVHPVSKEEIQNENLKNLVR